MQGCQGTGIPSNCSSTRGSLFNISSSTSWKDNGPWNLAIEDNLGTNYAADEGQFGWENVGLGFQGSGGPSLGNTVVAGLQTPDFWVGMLGLNPRPTNFSDFNHPQPSYLSLLYENQKIPSLSYSYTAGAEYRFNKVLGSLTLGGYDTSLYLQNAVTFPFFSDQSRDLTVGLKAITSGDGQAMLPNGILTLIDSTVSQIWLPIEACKIFESVFGLVYDTKTELYLVNDTQHTALQKQNTSLTFTIAPTLQGTDGLNITFPYSAFDLEVSYPLVNNTQRYFPLRRADNDTQYTLGRAFLQEAYLTVDYGRSNFSVSQRKWELTPTKHIVDILPANATVANSTSTGSGTGTGSNPSSTTAPTATSNTGAIAGGAIAAVAAIAAIAFGIWFYLRRRKRAAEEKTSAEAEVAQNVETATTPEEDPRKEAASIYTNIDSTYKHELDTPGIKAPELYGATYWGNVEMSAEERMAELADNQEIVVGRFELEAPHGMQELSNVERDRTAREMLPSQQRGGVTIQGTSQSRTRTPNDGSPRPFSWQAED